MPSIDTSYLIFIFCFVASRIVTNRSLKSLSAENKAALVDRMAGTSTYTLIPLLVLFVAYYTLGRTTQIDSRTLMLAFMSVMVILIITIQVASYLRIRSLDLGVSYLRQYTLARSLTLVGFGVLIATVVTP